MNWRNYVEDSRTRWEENAAVWDDRMSSEGNRWHRELIAPNVEKLLEELAGKTVLDIACGNGVFSRRLTELGAAVVAFDFSAGMIQSARARSDERHRAIEYHVLSATDETALFALGEARFDAAVSNMALMDIADISPLARSLKHLLKPSGAFVFSLSHPCFQTPSFREWTEKEDVGKQAVTRSGVLISRYIKPETYEGLSIRGQAVASRYFHRPLHVLLGEFFNCGFLVDGLEEPVFTANGAPVIWTEISPVLIVRLRRL